MSLWGGEVNSLRFIFNILSIAVYTAGFIVVIVYFFLRLGDAYTFETTDLFMLGVGLVMVLLVGATIKAMIRRKEMEKRQSSRYT